MVVFLYWGPLQSFLPSVRPNFTLAFLPLIVEKSRVDQRLVLFNSRDFKTNKNSSSLSNLWSRSLPVLSAGNQRIPHNHKSFPLIFVLWWCASVLHHREIIQNSILPIILMSKTGQAFSACGCTSSNYSNKLNKFQKSKSFNQRKKVQI